MTAPKDYLGLQYKWNNKHNNGEVEVTYEEAPHRVAWLATWIKENRVKADSFLDAGCRTGYTMDAIAKHFPAAEVWGVDLVPQFVKTAQLRGEAVVGDLQDLPFEARQFDWTVCCTAIEHCYDLPKAAAEMRRVSNIGYYILTDLEDKRRFDENPSHFTYHNDPAEWVDEFRHPEWWLMYLNVPRYSRIEMVWVRREHVHDFRKEDDAWR